MFVNEIAVTLFLSIGLTMHLVDVKDEKASFNLQMASIVAITLASGVGLLEFIVSFIVCIAKWIKNRKVVMVQNELSKIKEERDYTPV